MFRPFRSVAVQRANNLRASPAAAEPAITEILIKWRAIDRGGQEQLAIPSEDEIERSSGNAPSAANLDADAVIEAPIANAAL
jgi:hypothetical protein